MRTALETRSQGAGRVSLEVSHLRFVDGCLFIVSSLLFPIPDVFLYVQISNLGHAFYGF